jgi:predicted DCC family thiol-disulfide oxidoreductase YuxK
MSAPTDRPVLIFDGVCELCNSSVNFILRWEKRPEILFTANQNAPGRALLQQYGKDPDAVSTIYFVEDGKIYHQSAAIMRITRRLRFPWFLGYAFIIVPRFIRDFFYKLIAKNRYRLFGQKDTCRIPTPEEMARFLLE